MHCNQSIASHIIFYMSLVYLLVHLIQSILFFPCCYNQIFLCKLFPSSFILCLFSHQSHSMHFVLCFLFYASCTMHIGYAASYIHLVLCIGLYAYCYLHLVLCLRLYAFSSLHHILCSWYNIYLVLLIFFYTSFSRVGLIVSQTKCIWFSLVANGPNFI